MKSTNSRKKNLIQNERIIAKEVKKRFPEDQWQVFMIFSDTKENINTTKGS